MIFKKHPSPEGLRDKYSSKLHELYIDKFMELYHWEMKMLENLTLLQTSVESASLREKINLYQRKKGEQIENLQQAFILIDIPIKGKKNESTENMLESCINLTEGSCDDYQILHILLAINHYNQALYTWLMALTAKVGYDSIKNNLDQNLMIEKEFNQKIITVLNNDL